MKSKLIKLSILVLILIIPIILADQQSLGTFKKNDCVSLQQNCANCTYVNLTSIIFPDSMYALQGNYEMTKSDTNYNYTFCNTSYTGTYIYCVKGDPDNSLIVQCVDFDITPNGIQQSQASATAMGISIAILILMILISVYLTKFFGDRESGLAPLFFVLIFVFTSSAFYIAMNLTNDTLYYDVLFVIYRVMLGITFFMILYVCWKLLFNVMELRKMANKSHDEYNDEML